MHTLLTQRLNDGREGQNALASARFEALTALWTEEIGETSRPTLDAYRQRLEQRAARQVLAHEEAFLGYGGNAPAAPAVKEVWHLSRWELNGLFVALRMLGGYEDHTCNSDWARGVLGLRR